MVKYLLLIVAFALAYIGGAVGASTNSVGAMVACSMPGLIGIVGLMAIYGRK